MNATDIPCYTFGQAEEGLYLPPGTYTVYYRAAGMACAPGPVNSTDELVIGPDGDVTAGTNTLPGGGPRIFGELWEGLKTIPPLLGKPALEVIADGLLCEAHQGPPTVEAEIVCHETGGRLLFTCEGVRLPAWASRWAAAEAIAQAGGYKAMPADPDGHWGETFSPATLPIMEGEYRLSVRAETATALGNAAADAVDSFYEITVRESDRVRHGFVLVVKIEGEPAAPNTRHYLLHILAEMYRKKPAGAALKVTLPDGRRGVFAIAEASGGAVMV